MKFNLKALSLATSKTLLFIAALTIGAEISSPFKNFLAAVAGHHWIAKGIFAIVFFAASYALLSKRQDKLDGKELEFVMFSAIAGSVAIFVFYALHFLGA